MNAEDIVALGKIMGLEKMKKGNTWAKFACPFAPYRHEKGTDNNPSFGISIGKSSHYHCFSCGSSGPLAILPSALAFASGEPSNKKVREFILAHESFGLEPYEGEAREPLQPLSEVLLKRYDLPPEKYLEKRGITPETARLYGLLYDPCDDFIVDSPSVPRLLFPIRREDGRLVGIRGRSTTNVGVRYRAYSELSKNKQDPKGHGIFFGMQFPLVKGKMLVITEGEVDAMLIKQKGASNVWASMGATISRSQIETLRGVRNPLLLFFDNDEAGRLATEKISTKLRGLVEMYKVKDYQSCKDAGEAYLKGKLGKVLNSIEKMP